METPQVRLLFGRHLRRLRKKFNLTQEEVAEKAGLDNRYYQRIESQKPGAVKIDTIDRLAKAFKITRSKMMDF